VKITRAFPDFNSRRFSRPWGAIVTFPDGIKPSYAFTGHWDGQAVIIEAEPGAVVAFGQRDYRGNRTTKTLFVVGADGELTEVTEAAAREHATASRTASDLAAVQNGPGPLEIADKLMEMASVGSVITEDSAHLLREAAQHLRQMHQAANLAI